MIEKVVAAQVGGVAKLRFDAEGVSFDLEIPADRVVQTPLNPLSIT